MEDPRERERVRCSIGTMDDHEGNQAFALYCILRYVLFGERYGASCVSEGTLG